METEVWKDIPGYEGLYQVSNLWRVFSIWTKPSTKSRWRLFNWRKSRILKDRISWIMWHISVALVKNWVRKDIWVHRLVASAFLWLELFSFTCPKTSLCVCHKDDNPKNNCVNNLFLWTNWDNHRDMLKKWRRVFKKWIDHPLFWKEWIMKWKFWKLHHRSKEVEMYSLSNIFIKKFEWCRDAWRETWVNFWDISSCCIWKQKTAWWYKWKYVGDPNVAEESWKKNVAYFLM